MIDNDPEALWSALMDQIGENAYKSIASFSSDGRSPGAVLQFCKNEDTHWPRWLVRKVMNNHMHRVRDWFELATYFQLPFRDDVRMQILATGPPRALAPHISAVELIN
eukprot:2848852-Pyramimonas_sp.AAC.1